MTSSAGWPWPSSGNPLAGNARGEEMIARFLLVLLILVAATARADIQEIVVPYAGSIAFVLPGLTDVRVSGEAGEGSVYQYLAVAGRVKLDIRVGLSSCREAATHRAVMDCFLPDISGQKDMVPGSLKTNCDDRFCSAMSLGVAELGGARFKVYREHMFFRFGHYWADVHLSAIDPGEQDMEVMRAFVASLAYGKQ